MPDAVKELLSIDHDSTRLYYEVQPYDEVRLAGTPWIVYHQGDEEQHATVDRNGQLNVHGPHGWIVRHEAPAGT
jgi:hypothetical protein